MIQAVKSNKQGNDFLFNYSNRGNTEMLVQMGQYIASCADKAQGGVLVFFPSYSLLTEAYKVWN